MTGGGDRRKLTIFLFLVTSSFGFLQPFLPLYLEAAGLSRLEIGYVLGIGAGLALLIQPTLGRLSDRLDVRRPFIFLCSLAAGAAYLAFPHVSSPYAFGALVAIGTNGVMYLQSAGGVFVGRMVRASQGGAAYANIRVWGSVGYIVTALITGYMLTQRNGSDVSRASIDPIFRFGPLLFFGIAALAWFLPDARSASDVRLPAEKAPMPDNLRRFLGAYFLYTLALYGASGFLSLYLKSLGASGLGITGTFAAGVVVEVLVMRQSGRFSDRFGRRPALAVAFLLLPIRLLLYIPATGPLWVLAVQSLHGFNFGIVGAVAIAFANDLATDRSHGHAQARLAGVAGLATAVGPALFGAASQAMGLRPMFGLAAFIALLGAAILVFGVHDSHPESEPVADHGPDFLRPFLRLLDSPPNRKA